MITPVTKSSPVVDEPPTINACKYCTENNYACIKPGAYAQNLIPGLDDGCIRKYLLFAQLFACLPLIGVFIPNAVLVFTDDHYTIPLAHWVVCSCFLLIITGSFVIKLCFWLSGQLKLR